MRILSLYYTDKPGGFCKRLYRLLNALTERGHEVHYLSLDHRPAALAPGIHWQRIRFPLAVRGGILFWALFSLYLPFKALRALMEIRPERVVFFNPYYAALGGFPARLLKIPAVLFIRARLTRPGEPQSFVRGTLDRLGLAMAARVVCQTETAAKEVEKRGQKARVLPNDIPGMPARRTPPQPPFVAATTGVFVTGKNIALLIDAFAELERRHGDALFRLLVAGEGPSLESIKALAAKRNVRSVEFLGWVRDIHGVLKRSHVLLHPSQSEGMPNSVLEALGAGLAVLGARTPEMREVLENEDLLFDPASPLELAGKLEHCSQQPEMLKHLEELCAIRAAKFTFDWDNLASRLVTEPARY